MLRAGEELIVDSSELERGSPKSFPVLLATVGWSVRSGMSGSTYLAAAGAPPLAWRKLDEES